MKWKQELEYQSTWRLWAKNKKDEVARCAHIRKHQSIPGGHLWGGKNLKHKGGKFVIFGKNDIELPDLFLTVTLKLTRLLGEVDGAWIPM